MNSEPIQYFDRHAGRIRTEKVYGERWLRWAYGNPLGRLTLWIAVKRAWFSHWYGQRMDAPASREHISRFIENYSVDESEFLDSSETFKTFNEFFYRRLQPETRPIAKGGRIAVFPADGRHLGFADISRLDGVFVKGQEFDLPRLFGSHAAAAPYQHGTIVLSRLCPVDYHRFHFPASGMASVQQAIQGSLNSVNPIALRRRLAIFWENKRNLSYLNNKYFGRIANFEIGATCVGSMIYSASLPCEVAKGEEKGYFSFGGSSVLTLFEPNRISLTEDLLSHSSRQRELYARMGESMGQAIQ